MAFVRAVKRLQIIYGVHIIGTSQGGGCCRGAPRRLPLPHQQLLLVAEAIRRRVALVDPQRGHIDVHADEAAQPVPSTRRYGDAVRDEPLAQRAREVRVGPPALVVVIRRARRKFRGAQCRCAALVIKPVKIGKLKLGEND